MKIGYSPCPNDTFIFDAMVHERIDTEGITFEPVLADVETLNQMAFRGELPITKLSFHALGHVLDRYALLDAGAALGHNCGPLLIAKEPFHLAEAKNKRIAIPGKYTTANFLLSIAAPEAKNKEELVFSEIEDAVLTGKVDAGLIIHENRFTYQNKGLVKIIDLGEWWESTYGVPIPLGGIAVDRNLPKGEKEKINRVLRRSVEYAFEHPEASLSYTRAHAQEMDEDVMKQHIALYVNSYSIDLGAEGRKAVELLYEKAAEEHIITSNHSKIFLN